MSYESALQVKQLIGVVVNGRGQRFRVLATGDSKRYLFCAIDENGCDLGMHIPVLKTSLINPCKRALANGCGFDMRAYKRLNDDIEARKELKKMRLGMGKS